MRPLDAQARCLMSWGLLSRPLIEAAYREAQRRGTDDLCELLVRHGSLKPEHADRVRAAVAQVLAQARQYDPRRDSWRGHLQRAGSGELEEADLAATQPLTAVRPELLEQEARPTEFETLRINRSQAPAPLLDAPASLQDRRPTTALSPASLDPRTRALLARLQLPNYEVLSLLASGGLGAVLRARHKSGSVVAVKVLFQDSGDDEDLQRQLKRFRREASTLTSLRHPHIVRVLEFGELEANAWMTMELVEGDDLGKILAAAGPSQRPQLPWLLRILEPIIEAVRYCHERGVVHRDIKPANIIIESQTRRPVLVDFGSIRTLPSESETNELYSTLATSGEVVGTPAYMAPEQLDASGTFGNAGRPADVWGLAATLFYGLTGEPPFGDKHINALLIALATQSPRRLRSLRPELPEELDALIHRCLQREQDDRPKLSELISGLHPFL